MANGNNPKQRKSTKTSFKPGDFQFANVRLSKDDKAAFEQWATEHVPDAFDLLDAVVNSGVKASYSWSESVDAFSFSLTGMDERSANFHVVMTSKADNFQEALMLALYKHYVVCGEQDWPIDQQENSWG